jgi:hypothetical protein
MELIEVKSKEEIRWFRQVAKHIYASDNKYIPHLIDDIEAVFNKPSSAAAKRWVIVGNKKPIGRIAAFTTSKPGAGGLGFFECVDNEEIAHLLFQTGIDWLKHHDIIKIQAPINFGERDKYWGLLVDGFDPGSYQENYNPFYYKSLFESFGFKPDFNQITYRIDKSDFDVERIAKLFKRVQQNANLNFRHFESEDLATFARDFAYIYNHAWKENEDFVELTPQRVAILFKEMKPVIQNNLIWLAYDKEEPIGFFINVLEINYALKSLEGVKSLLGGLKYAIKRKVNPPNTSRGIVFGIVPAYQNKGIDVGMIYNFYLAVQMDVNIRYCILSWIGDFNSKMNSLMEALGAKKYKIHTTYRLNY